jgi:hypothetical protein
MNSRLLAIFVVPLLLAAGAAAAQPDLKPLAGELAAGVIGVVNQGGKPASATLMTLACDRAEGGLCPRVAEMAAFDDLRFPRAAAVPVPALAPGESFVFALPYWDSISWPTGRYRLTLTVDAGGMLAEGNELNNEVVVTTVH